MTKRLKITGLAMTTRDFVMGRLPSGRPFYYDPEGARCSVPIPLLYGHVENMRLGEVVEIMPSSDGLRFTAIVTDPAAVERLQNDDWFGVSIGCGGVTDVDDVRPFTATGWSLREISLIEDGDQLNPGARVFTIEELPAAPDSPFTFKLPRLHGPLPKRLATAADIDAFGVAIYGPTVWAKHIANRRREQQKRNAHGLAAPGELTTAG